MAWQHDETKPAASRPESQGDTIHVALAADANHFAALPGAILSAVNHTSAPFSFHVLVPPEQLASAKSALACFGVPLAAPKLAVDVLPFRPQLAAPVRVVADAAVTGNLASPLNFARFELSRLLPSLSRLLYLDADVMVQADLGELWRTDLPQGTAVGAVPRTEAHFKYKRYAAKCSALYEARNGAPLQPENPTFNAGVLLIDLTRWRQQNLTAEAEWWMARHAAAPDGLWALGSQPPLHLALHGRWAALPPSWNLDGLGRIGNLRPAALGAAKLLHWTGKHKPWLPDGMYVSLWRRHVRTLCAASGTGSGWHQVPWPRKNG